MISRRLGRVMLLAVLLAALPGCAGQADPGSLAPSVEPGMQRMPVMPTTADVRLLESQPVQVRLDVTGELPSGCARLGWAVAPGDDQGRIQLAIYMDEPTEAVCDKPRTPYDESIPLGSFERGSYGVFVNGTQVADFILP